MREASELRVKESDRIASTVRLLRAFGAEAREVADGIIVRGGSPLREPPVIDTHEDHRIGMTAAALAAAVGVPVEIRDAACISTSFPDFADRDGATRSARPYRYCSADPYGRHDFIAVA